MRDEVGEAMGVGKLPFLTWIYFRVHGSGAVVAPFDVPFIAILKEA